MKFRTAEKLSVHSTRRGVMRFRRWWKRQSSKLMRRMVREDPEEAPRRLPIRGWFD